MPAFTRRSLFATLTGAAVAAPAVAARKVTRPAILVTESKIANCAIATTKIANGSVDLAQVKASRVCGYLRTNPPTRFEMTNGLITKWEMADA